MAVINYLPEMGGWLVSLAFPAQGKVTQLTSRLIYANETSASLTLTEDQLISSYDPQKGAALVSFSIAERDVGRFRRASRWEVDTGQEVIGMTLDGSAAALRKVIEARDGLRTRASAD